MVFTFGMTLKPCLPAAYCVHSPNYLLLHFLVIAFNRVRAVSKYHALNYSDEVLNLAPSPSFWHGHLLFQGCDPKQRDSVEREWVSLSTLIDMLIFGELRLNTAPSDETCFANSFLFLPVSQYFTNGNFY